MKVRSRILAVVVGLSALVLAAAGYTAFAIQQVQVEDRIDAELAADTEQFRVLQEERVDPRTGSGFTSPEDLVRIAMAEIIPTRNEGALGLADGEVRYTSPVSRLPLDQDEQLIDALVEIGEGDRATVQTLRTDTTTYRAAVVPVHSVMPESGATLPDEPSAAFVLAYDIAAEKRLFAEGFGVYALIAAVSLVVVALVGWLLAGRLLHPVGVLADTARRIGREDLSERIPVTGHDDLAEMTRSVNEMLERLEGAFTAQEQLVQDVRHELRTPITILRGHLEVMQTDSVEDVTATRELALDELSRMNRVVDELTTLAQAEHPAFVTHAEVSLGQLTDEVYDKACGLGDHRWRIDSRAEAQVPLDRQRITQAWLQLAANAAKFSPPGSVVTLASVCTEDQVRISVRDQGCGIAEEDQHRIFERFERAGAAVPGTGLGLSIVRAIAVAHGGHVEVDSEPQAGATFTMVLPRQPLNTPGVVTKKETS